MIPRNFITGCLIACAIALVFWCSLWFAAVRAWSWIAH